jgi:hypothetical protein
MVVLHDTPPLYHCGERGGGESKIGDDKRVDVYGIDSVTLLLFTAGLAQATNKE